MIGSEAGRETERDAGYDLQGMASESGRVHADHSLVASQNNGSLPFGKGCAVPPSTR